MNEDDWQRQVIDTARMFGWRVGHFRPALTRHGWRTPVSADGKGFPDLILLRDACIAVELKTDDPASDLTTDQRLWLAAFETAGIENHVWRPRDAEAVMRRLARRRTDRV